MQGEAQICLVNLCPCFSRGLLAHMSIRLPTIAARIARTGAEGVDKTPPARRARRIIVTADVVGERAPVSLGDDSSRYPKECT